MCFTHSTITICYKYNKKESIILFKVLLSLLIKYLKVLCKSTFTKVRTYDNNVLLHKKLALLLIVQCYFIEYE